VGSFSFAVLFLACLASLLGMRFALEPLARQLAELQAEAAPPPEAVMALPPKPGGLEDLPDAQGAGEGPGGRDVYTRERCEAYEASLEDTCYQALARQGAARDPRAALEVCALIGDAEMRDECRADTAEASAPVDRAASEAICAEIASVKWRGQCHFGIGLALAETDPTYAFDRCTEAEAFRDFCRHDVVGEVALVALEAAVTLCAREEGDVLTRKTCWHGIGKYLARRDFAEASRACDRTTPDWRGNCYHGIGWGAAERDPDAALAGCDGLGEFTDNCRQGVAHQLKRFDPDRAVAICESIGSSIIRTRCLAFVTR
jgi:hypothetical protein